MDLLRWICRAVSPLTPPSAVPPLPETLWPQALVMADRHLLLPDLHLALGRHGHADTVPGDIAGLLEALHSLNSERNGLLRDQMREISLAFSKAEIRHVWLKGAAELTLTGWEASGRMMNDLDIWVPDLDRQADALSALDGLGYRIMPGETDAAWLASHHAASRCNDAWPVRVEPHRHVVEPTCAALLPDASVLGAVIWKQWRGCRIGIPAPEHRVLHAAVQASAMAVPDFGTGRTPLMKALDIVRIAAAQGWASLPDTLLTELRRPDWLVWSRPLLTVTEDLFGLPNPVKADARVLRRLRFVSTWPRLGLAVEIMARVGDGRLFRRLARPSTLPELFGRYVRILRSGRDFR